MDLIEILKSLFFFKKETNDKGDLVITSALAES